MAQNLQSWMLIERPLLEPPLPVLLPPPLALTLPVAPLLLRPPVPVCGLAPEQLSPPSWPPSLMALLRTAQPPPLRR